MTTNDNHLDTPLWNYAVECWHQPDLQALLLLLQEQYNFRVNLILLACWVGSEGKQFSTKSLESIHERTLHWHESTVKTLRSMRRNLTPSDDTSSLIDSLRQAEVNAEKIELLRLYDDSRDGTLQPASIADEDLATVHNLLILFEMAPTNLHQDLLVQLSSLVVDSLDELRAAELIRSLRTP